MYTDGAEIVYEALDAIRREAEKAECLQGFQISHSIGGGTGSGLGSLIMERVREEYPDRVLTSYAVLPSLKISEEILLAFNAYLALNKLKDDADSCVVLSNEAL